MFDDRFGLTVTTVSREARDKYLTGCELLLTLYPGAIEALTGAIATDPQFALAHVAKARALQLRGDVTGAMASLAVARDLTPGLTEREASQVSVFADIFSNSQGPGAVKSVIAHLQEWPRDALVLSTCASQIGLIGLSGLVGREQLLADLLDGLAAAYGDDWWFLAHHGMALSEVGRRKEARLKIERSRERREENALMAHAHAHICYEDGEPEAAVAFMRQWLRAYPRQSPLYGHLSWHLALGELEMGEAAEAFRLYSDAITAEDYPGPAVIKLADAASFLWRAELAGHPRDPIRWAALQQFASKMFPRAGMAIADWHVALLDAVAGNGDSLEARTRQMEDLARDGRYPSGPLVPKLARALSAFQQGDFGSTIDVIKPILAERERIGGSRAQTDLVEFTLLSAYVAAGRLDDMQDHLRDRHPRAATIPIAGLRHRH